MVLLYHAAAIVYLVQLLLFATLHAVGSYSPLRHAVSDYGVGVTKRRFAAYGSAGIIGAVLLSAAVLLDRRIPDTGGLYLLATAALRLGVLAFPTDLEGQTLTRTGKLHYVFAIASFALAYMAIDALHPHVMPLVAGALASLLQTIRWIVTAALIGVVICLIPSLRSIFGLVERSVLLSTILWFGMAAFALA